MHTLLLVFATLSLALPTLSRPTLEHPTGLSSCASACKTNPTFCHACITKVNRTYEPSKPAVVECTGQPCFETCTDPYDTAFWTCVGNCANDPYCEYGCYNFFIYDACTYCACGPCDCNWDDGNGSNTCYGYC